MEKRDQNRKGVLDLRENMDRFFNSDNKVRIIFIVGIIGIVLIFLSSFLKLGKSDGQSAAGQEFDSAQYTADLEKKIHAMVSGIDGVGEAKVIITLESSTEYVYVNEKKETADSTKDYADGETKKEQERNNYEQNVILIDQTGGKREALLKTTLEPKVKGVVVVCQGGENVEVEKRVTDAVTTALAISSSKVCVVQLSEP